MICTCGHWAYEHEDIRRGEPCLVEYEPCECVGYEPEVIG